MQAPAARNDPAEPPRVSEVTWLEPYPALLLEGIPDRQPGPEARFEASEAISLAFITALQLLPPRQRAALMFVVSVTVYFTGVAATNVLAQTFTQTYVPHHLLSRYSSAVGIVIRGTQPLGALIGAVVGGALGPRAAMWLAGLVITASAAVLFQGPLRDGHDLPPSSPNPLQDAPPNPLLTPRARRSLHAV